MGKIVRHTSEELKNKASQTDWEAVKGGVLDLEVMVLYAQAKFVPIDD